MEPVSTYFLVKGLLIAAGAGAAVLAFLAISKVRDYLRTRRTQKSAQAMSAVMRRKLASGEYVVAAGFFEDGELTDVKEWTAREVDAEIKALPDGVLVTSGRAGS